MKILFGDYLPDRPDYASEGLETISNALPGVDGYRPVKAFQSVSTALADKCKGASSFVSPGGVSILISGTATNLYRFASGGWSSIGSGYSLQEAGRWRFAQFGGLAVALNEADPMQKIDLQAGTVSALGGSPPKAQMLTVVQNFLVAGVLDGDARTIGWSGENDAEYWAFGSRKSDFNIFADGGAVTGLIGGEFGLVLQRGAVRRMTYVGGNILFRFDKIASNTGCVSVHSVAQYGELAFWLSDSGFMMWDGAQIKPIGNERVDRTFSALYAEASWPNMSTAIDAGEKSVMWSLGDKIWLYNWNLDKWTIINIASEIIFGGFTKSLSIDEQDTTVGPPDDDIDSVGLDDFDDPRFIGGDPRLYMFNTSHIMGALDGSNMAASFGLRHVEIIGSRDTKITRVRPMCDVTGGVTLAITAKQRLGDAGTAKTFTALNSSGVMPTRSNGRFIKPTFSIDAGQVWAYAQGLDANPKQAGAR